MAFESKAAALGLEVVLRQSAPIALDVRLECGPGELVALLGPSGSGKTTVLRSIAGLHHPQHGRVACDAAVWLDTERGRRTSPQKRRVGLVFQHYALFPHMSALENVEAPMADRAPSERERRARELLARLNMEGLEHRRPEALSGGQRQRVALARALAREPAVLLLDEPFSAVDQMTRRRLRLELAQLRRTLRIPVVLVTHDLEEAQMLADRLSLLRHGRTLQTGPTREVMRRPVNAQAARLLDHTNLFRGRVLEHEPDNALTWIEWAGIRIECRHAPGFAPGEQIEWLVPRSDVVLHRRDRPSRGEHENPVQGTVTEIVVLGEDAFVTMSVDGASQPLSLTVSTHVARRNRVEIGEPIGASLLSEGVHLMARG